MEVISDIKSFSKILRDKGYTGLYKERTGRSGTIAEILKDYLSDPAVKSGSGEQLLLRSCLGWKHTAFRWHCTLSVKCIGAKFFLDKIIFEKVNGTGKPVDRFTFNNLTVMTAPSIKNAVSSLEIKNVV